MSDRSTVQPAAEAGDCRGCSRRKAGDPAHRTRTRDCVGKTKIFPNEKKRLTKRFLRECNVKRVDYANFQIN